MAKTLGPVAALLVGVFFLVAGSGLQNTLLPLRGAFEGFSALNLGILGSCYYLGFVLGCLIVPRLVRQSGHIRTFAALTALAVATMLAQSIRVDPLPWYVLRTLTGFSFAGLFLVIESWLNDRATNRTRGVVMSAYVMVNYVALTVGQLMITLYPVGGFELFALATILFALATLPVAFTRTGQPTTVPMSSIRPIRLFRAAPVAMVGSFVIGMTNGSLWSLGPIFGIGRGLTADGAATFMSAVVIAGALAQWPAGLLSDRMDRRRVMAGLLVGAVIASLLLGLIPASFAGLAALGFVYGALALPAYSLAAAHAYDRTAPEEAVETAAGVLLAYGIGSVAGPSVASLAMTQIGPGGLFLFNGAAYTLLFGYVLWRIAGREAPVEKPSELHPCPPTGTVAVAEMAPEILPAPRATFPQPAPAGDIEDAVIADDVRSGGA